MVGGERGIRTPGGVTLNGFQDRRIRPLCHLSGAKIENRLMNERTSGNRKMTAQEKPQAANINGLQAGCQILG